MRKIGDVFAGDKNRLAMAACKCFDLIMKNFLEIPRNNKNENSLQSPAGVSKRGNSINKHLRREKSGGGVLESNFFFFFRFWTDASFRELC